MRAIVAARIWFAVCLFSADSVSDDICYQYQRYFNSSTNSLVSFCDEKNICQNLLEVITCDEALNRLIDSQEIIINIPPIVSHISDSEQFNVVLSHRLYHEIMSLDDDPDYFPFAQPPPRDEVDSSMQEPAFVEFEAVTRQVASSIIERFPKLVFNETVDGQILSDFVDAAKRIRQVSEIVPAIALAVHQSDPFREYAWAIRMMVDHVIFSSGLSFKHTERLLVSMAPWMHAFLHALFLIEIHFHGLLEDVASWDIINAIVKYHPIYTRNDGVWYIRTTRRWESIFSRPPLMIDGPDEDHIISLWDSTDDFLNASTTSLIPSDDFHSMYDYEKISAAYLTLQFIRETSSGLPEPLLNLTSEQIEVFNDYVETNFCVVLHGRVAIADILNSFILPKNLLRVICAYDSANNFIDIRSGNHRRVITINKSQIAISTLYIISAYTKYDLAGQIQFLFTDYSDVPEDPKPYPGGIEVFYEDLMEEIFDIKSGFFETVDGSFRRTRGTQSLDLFLSPIEVSVSIGRILGLVFQAGNPGNLLTRFSIAREKSTILDSFFFGSYHIRAGFYDVYHDNMLERFFSNNGTKLYEALVRSQEVS